MTMTSGEPREVTLLEFADEQLKYWFALATLADQEGLPADLMYYICRDTATTIA